MDIFSVLLRRSEFGLFQSLGDSAGPSWPEQAAFSAACSVSCGTALRSSSRLDLDALGASRRSDRPTVQARSAIIRTGKVTTADAAPVLQARVLRRLGLHRGPEGRFASSRPPGRRLRSASSLRVEAAAASSSCLTRDADASVDAEPRAPTGRCKGPSVDPFSLSGIIRLFQRLHDFAGPSWPGQAALSAACSALGNEADGPGCWARRTARRTVPRRRVHGRPAVRARGASADQESGGAHRPDVMPPLWN